MKIAHSWPLLSRAPAAEQRRLQDGLLERYVREELYAFSPHYRRLFDEAGVDPRSIRRVDDLRRLPFTTREHVATAGGESLILLLGPRAIRSQCGFGRKLALALGGRRAHHALQASYTPSLVTRSRRRSQGLEMTCTGHDLDVLGEVGARMTDLLGLAPAARVVNAFPGGPHLAFWQTTLGTFRAGCLLLSPTGPPAGRATLELLVSGRATALVAPPAFARRIARTARAEGARDLSSLDTVVLGGARTTRAQKHEIAADLGACGAEEVRIARAYGLTAARMAFVESPTGIDDDPGYCLWPDLCVVEVIDPETLDPVGEGEPGELVFTTLCGHGSAVLRYRTGDWAEGGVTWSPCPHSGRTVPRVSSELRSLTVPTRPEEP